MKNLTTIAFLLISLPVFSQRLVSVGAFFHESDLPGIKGEALDGYTIRFDGEYPIKRCPMAFFAPGLGIEYKWGENSSSAGYRANANVGLSALCGSSRLVSISAGFFAYTPLGKYQELESEAFSAGTRFRVGIDLSSKFSCGLVANYAFTTRKERQIEFCLARRI